MGVGGYTHWKKSSAGGTTAGKWGVVACPRTSEGRLYLWFGQEKKKWHSCHVYLHGRRFPVMLQKGQFLNSLTSQEQPQAN